VLNNWLPFLLYGSFALVIPAIIGVCIAGAVVLLVLSL